MTNQKLNNDLETLGEQVLKDIPQAVVDTAAIATSNPVAILVDIPPTIIDTVNTLKDLWYVGTDLYEL